MNRRRPFPTIIATLTLASFCLPGCAPQRTGLHPGAPARPLPTTPPPSTQPLPAAPFAKEIEAFERADKTNPPPRDSVVFVGSSSIRLWKTLEQDFSAWPVLNRGFGGSQVIDSVRYADRIVLPYRPRAVVLYAGDNDLAAGKSPDQVFADFRAFVAKVHAARPTTPILFLAIKPSTARRHLLEQQRQANKFIEQFAAGHEHVDYVDTFTPMLTPEGEPRADLLVADGLHLNEEGYRLWAGIVRKALDRSLAGGRR